MYVLHIANKNYSSWSLRPWVLMRALGLDFEEKLEPFSDGSSWNLFRRFSPTGLVPCLIDDGMIIWDSMGITEYLADNHPQVWPADKAARAWARCAAAEMHSGFGNLREICSMSVGIRVELHNSTQSALEKDLKRINELWLQGLHKFGGPFLAGDKFTAVDAFYAPLMFRVQTYGLQLEPEAMAYIQHMLAQPAMQQWYNEALHETWRDRTHEVYVTRYGRIVEDLRTGN
ncbi:MAG TPA: glutathione S-transferase family protein [Pseudohongiella sp.]|nr:glutathione S-transferase family protein [Pseudohongiella sp.]